jgi:hypothetical protein
MCRLLPFTLLFMKTEPLNYEITSCSKFRGVIFLHASFLTTLLSLVTIYYTLGVQLFQR